MRTNYSSHYVGQPISAEQIKACANTAKDRNCVSCGEHIKAGELCPCQAVDAINCPRCNQNIPHNEIIARFSIHVTEEEGRFEARINCQRKGCGGYLYADLYLADFVQLPPIADAKPQEKAEPEK